MQKTVNFATIGRLCILAAAIIFLLLAFGVNLNSGQFSAAFFAWFLLALGLSGAV